MDTLGTFMFPLLIIGIFYMLVFRPQQKKMKQHQNMVSNLAKGDEVVTAGGLIGKVTKIKADSNEIEVQFAKDLPSVKVVQATIADVTQQDSARQIKIPTNRMIGWELEDVTNRGLEAGCNLVGLCDGTSICFAQWLLHQS